MSHQVRLHMTMPQASPADRWISRAAAGTVAALTGLAGAISYSHMRQLAQQHGQTGWHAHAFPLSVDGLEIVASLVLLADHRAGRRPGWLPWAALMIGTAGSLAANIATAAPGTISRTIAGWPAVALLIAVKLLTGMLNHSGTMPSRPRNGKDRPDELPRRSRRGPPARVGDPTVMSSPNQPTVQQQAGPPSATAALVADPPPGIADLLPAARAARDELYRAGELLTRDALAARLRQTGHPIRNARLTALLHVLRSEATTLTSARSTDKTA